MSQNNSVVAFNFQSNEIRTATKEDGTAWFAAKDVSGALGIRWTGHTLDSIPKHWRSMVSYTTHEGKRELTIISEPAVYKLAFRSNKPEAEAFTNWVASEVLPAIRKTGRYELPTLTPEQQRKVQQAIGEKVYATCNKAMYPTYFKHVYGAIKDKFLVGKYNQVPASQFDELIAYVQKVSVGTQFDENTMLHAMDVINMATDISHAIQKITVALVSIQPDLGRLLSNVCILMPKEFEEVKRRLRIEEKAA